MTGEPAQWSLSHVWDALRKFWFLVIGLSLIGGVAGYLVSASIEPQFQARASLYFALNQGTSGSDLNQGAAYTQNQMLSFARIATSSRVLERVIDDLDMELTPRALAQSVTVTIPQDTAVLDVTASSTDPERAAAIANSVSENLAQVVQAVAAESGEGAATITATVIDDAVPPAVQSLPNKPRDAVLAAVIGFLAGVLIALIATAADTRVRNEAAVARVTDLPVLGVVGRTKRKVGAGLIVARQAHSRAAEDMRKIQSALAFTAIDAHSRRLLITSASPGEGKSTFATNLALALAGAGERTLVIDGDLRRPRVANLFGIDGSVGLTTVLMGDIELADATVSWSADGPDVLAAGNLPPSPATVLTSRAFRSALEDATEHYDVVIIDSPPVLSVADANLLVPLTDGVVIVVDAAKTRRPQLAEALRSIESAGGRVVGIVLNKARVSTDRVAYYEDAPSGIQHRHGRSASAAHRSPATDA